MLKIIAKAGAIIGFASLISRGLGLYREHLLSKLFGGITGGINVLDSYYIAFKLPDLAFNIILLGVGTAVLVPLYTQLRKNPRDFGEGFWTISFITSMVVCLLCVVLYILIPVIIPAIFFTYPDQIIDQSISLARIMVLSPFFFTLSTLIGSYLQSFRLYVYSHLSPIIYNIGILVGITYLYPSFGMAGIAYGVVAGSALHFLIQIPFLIKSGLPKLGISNRGLAHFWYCLKQTGIRGITIASSQLNLFVESIVAGVLVSGSLSLYTWAQNIYFLPLGLAGISLSIPALTHFSELYHEGKEKELSTLLFQITSGLFFSGILFGLFMHFESQNIVRLIFDYGKFSDGSGLNADTLASTLSLFALALPFSLMAPIFIRFSHARMNMVIPLWGAVISIIVNIILNYILTILMHFGLSGLAISFICAEIAKTVYYYLAFGCQHKHFFRFMKLSDIPFLITGALAFWGLNWLDLHYIATLAAASTVCTALLVFRYTPKFVTRLLK